MLRLTFARILHDRRRLTLTITAIAVGVTFLTAALVLSGSTRSALEASYRQVYAGTDALVRGPETPGGGGTDNGAPLGDDVVDAIRGLDGVASVDGRRRTVAQLLDGAEDATAIAIDVPADPATAAIALRSGRLPAGSDEVALDAALASQAAVTVGDTIEVLLPSGHHEATVVGTIGFGPLDGLAGGGRMLFDAASAAALLGDGYADIAVVATSGTSADTLAAQLTQHLDDGVRVVTAEQAASRDAATAAQQTAAPRWILTGVAIVALLIGGFVIANTFQVLVTQRARELALLRAVGATRRQVARSIRLEAALTGAIGAVLGVVAGLAVGAVLVSMSGGLLPGLPPTSATISVPMLLVGPAVGVALASLAAHSTARRVLTVAPVAALGAVALQDRQPSRLRIVLGALLLLGGVALTVLGVGAGNGVIIAAGVAVTVLGVGAVFPVITGPVLAVLSRPIGRTGPIGSLARQQALAAPRRIGATAASLVVTVALVTLLLVFNASLGASVPAALAARQHAEYSLTSSAPPGLQDGVREVAAAAEELPGVATAATVTYVDLTITEPDGDDDPRARGVAAHVVDPVRVDQLLDVHPIEGQLTSLGDGAVAVRDRLATQQGWQVGDRLRVELPDGSDRELTIAVRFEGAITTDWLLAPVTVDGHVPAPYDVAFIRLADGADVDAVEAQLDVLVTGQPALQLVDRDEQAAQMADDNESSLGILTALFALSLVVGGLGIANTLTLAIHERLRELGLLRATGATRRQVRTLVRWEAVLTTLLGAIVGLVLGGLGAWVALSALPGSTALAIPATHLVLVLVGTVVIGLGAASVPARRAANVNILDAVAAA